MEFLEKFIKKGKGNDTSLSVLSLLISCSLIQMSEAPNAISDYNVTCIMKAISSR